MANERIKINVADKANIIDEIVVAKEAIGTAEANEANEAKADEVDKVKANEAGEAIVANKVDKIMEADETNVINNIMANEVIAVDRANLAKKANKASLGSYYIVI